MRRIQIISHVAYILIATQFWGCHQEQKQSQNLAGDSVSLFGHTYYSVNFQGMKWLDRNIYLPQVVNSSSGIIPVPECSFKDENYCKVSGSLFRWQDVFPNISNCTPDLGCIEKVGTPITNLCPDGWHIPSSSEWNHLFGIVGGVENAVKELRAERWKKGISIPFIKLNDYELNPGKFELRQNVPNSSFWKHFFPEKNGFVNEDYYAIFLTSSVSYSALSKMKIIPMIVTIRWDSPEIIRVVEGSPNQYGGIRCTNTMADQ